MRFFAVIALSVFLLLSCSRPDAEESFFRLRGGDGVCRFEVDLSDSAATYDIDLYSRLDGLQRCRESFPVRMDWTSPSGATYSEEVVFPLDGSSVLFSDAISTQVQVPYRSYLRPVEHGVWILEANVGKVRGLCGIGLICERKVNGTR